MTTANTYDIYIDQGGTFSMTITMRDSANNNLFVGATSAEAQLREQPANAIKIGDFDCEFAANNASLTLSLTANTTADFTKKLMFWDCKVFWADREEYILRGKAHLSLTVTR